MLNTMPKITQKIELPPNASASLAKISQGLQELNLPLSVSFNDGTGKFRVVLGDIEAINSRLPIAVQMVVNQTNQGELNNGTNDNE